MRWMAWLLLACLCPGVARADVPRSAASASFQQRLGNHIPLDLPFLDETGQPVTLGTFVHDKPAVLVPAWYKCPGLCPEVQNGVLQCLLDLPQTVGQDLQVVTVSIDPSDTTDLARWEKSEALQRYGCPGASAGFHYLTGARPAIDALCLAIGFHYVYDAASKQYAHESGIVVLTPKGQVSRYLFGVRYSANTLKLALTDAGQDHVGGLAEQLYLLCFRYDPTTGRYGLAVMRLLRAAGVVTMGGFGFFVWRHRHG